MAVTQKPLCDLHMHSYFSDGRASPAELVEQAARLGLRQLAITDHDNTCGAREAAPLAAALGIELIPGIELTCRWEGPGAPLGNIDVDLLGYFMDWEAPAFQARERAALDDIHARVGSLCQTLTANGCPVRLEELFAENPRYAGALQLVQAILTRRYAGTWRDASHLMTKVWEASRDTPFTIRSVIEQIHLAGGVAMLAHPTVVRPRGERMTGAYLARLVEMGLDGIEIYHRRLDQQARAYFLGLAAEFGLLVSGGSDTHGWVEGLNELGEQPVTQEMVEKLREKARMNVTTVHSDKSGSPGCYNPAD